MVEAVVATPTLVAEPVVVTPPVVAAVVPPVVGAAIPNPDPTKDVKPEVEGANKEPAKVPEQVVPYVLEAPKDTPIDPKGVTEFTAVANELKLPKEQAEKLMAWYAKRSVEEGNQAVNAWKTTNEGWVKQVKEDKDIGGDKFDSSVGLAKQAIAKFGNPEFSKALEFTGMGNNPEMIRFLVTVAKAFGEDKLPTGPSKAVGGVKSAAEILFPTHTK